MIVRFTGSADRVTENRSDKLEARTLTFCFSVEYNHEIPQDVRQALGVMDIGPLLKRAIRSCTPGGIRLKVRQSHPCKSGVDARTVTIVFYMVRKAPNKIPTGRALWEMVPLGIGNLAGLVRDSAGQTLLNDIGQLAA